jgi:hypothetical protein
MGEESTMLVLIPATLPPQALAEPFLFLCPCGAVVGRASDFPLHNLQPHPPCGGTLVWVS